MGVSAPEEEEVEEGASVLLVWTGLMGLKRGRRGLVEEAPVAGDLFLCRSPEPSTLGAGKTDLQFSKIRENLLFVCLLVEWP